MIKCVKKAFSFIRIVKESSTTKTKQLKDPTMLATCIQNLLPQEQHLLSIQDHKKLLNKNSTKTPTFRRPNK